jgi:hypothetical protein
VGYWGSPVVIPSEARKLLFAEFQEKQIPRAHTALGMTLVFISKQACNTTASGSGQTRQDFGGVALRGCLRPNGSDFAIGIDQKRAADNPLEGTAHELLRLPRAVGSDHFVIGIAQQRKIQFPLELEIGQRFHGIGAHPQDDGVRFFEFAVGVTKLGRFDDSTGSVGFGKEKQNDVLAVKILERDGRACVGSEREFGSMVADFNHHTSLSGLGTPQA